MENKVKKHNWNILRLFVVKQKCVSSFFSLLKLLFPLEFVLFLVLTKIKIKSEKVKFQLVENNLSSGILYSI